MTAGGVPPLRVYTIRNWSQIYENNRSRAITKLSWVAIPNRHDGENYSAIVSHERGAQIFAAWILMVEVASRCEPRGTLIRENGSPHTPLSLSLKTRAPQEWFQIALDYLVEYTDWLEYKDVAGTYRPPDVRLTSGCASRARAEQDRIEQNGSTNTPPVPPTEKEKVCVISKNEKNDPNSYPLPIVEPQTVPHINGAEDLRSLVNALYGRPDASIWTHPEEYALAGVARRPEWRTEMAEIQNLFQRAPRRFLAQSVQKLLENWPGVLDRARMPAEKKDPKTKSLLDKMLDESELETKRILREIGM